MQTVINQLKSRGFSFTSETEPFDFYKENPQHPYGNNTGRKKYTAVEMWHWLRSQVVTDLSEICFNPVCRMEFCRHFREVNKMTFREIAEIMGISHEQARQLYMKSFLPAGRTKWSKKGPGWKDQYESGETVQGIAEKEGCSTSVITLQIKKAGGIIDRHRKRGKKEK
jgi:hypothetical protein